MSRALAVALASLACLAAATPGPTSAQEPTDSAARGPGGRPRVVREEYDALTDSTTRSASAYAVVDTSLAPPDTFALELSQRWKGRGAVAPVAAIELGLGRIRPAGIPADRRLTATARRRPAVVFLLDGARRVVLEQAEYVSGGGRTITFETARYRIEPADLRRVAESQSLRVRVGDREFWIDPAWRRVAAEVAAWQAPAAPDTARRPP